MPSGSGELELLGSDSIGKNPVVWRFFWRFMFCLHFLYGTDCTTLYNKDVFHVFSYPRKWIQVVQLGDWALPGRIRCYAQRRKPPFFLGICTLPWYQNDSWWSRDERCWTRKCAHRNPHVPLVLLVKPFRMFFFGKFLCSGLGWLDSSSVCLLNIVELFSKNLVDLERSSHLISFELKADRSGTTDRISSGSICQ
jgi:hypothetical protein